MNIRLFSCVSFSFHLLKCLFVFIGLICRSLFIYINPAHVSCVYVKVSFHEYNSFHIKKSLDMYIGLFSYELTPQLHHSQGHACISLFIY